MEDLEDELDLRHLKGLDPDVYYRCPTTESMDGALRNEMDRSASSLIPTEVVTEFVFAAASTITIPAHQQSSLEAILQPADFPQSITVQYALCSNIEGKDRLKIQRAVTRSIVEAIQDVDGFKYTEIRAQNKEGSDGVRFSYVCQSSTQNRSRKRNVKKEAASGDAENENDANKEARTTLPTFDCSGAIHLKFSLRRAALNVVYKHNPIHDRPPESESLPVLVSKDHGFLNTHVEDRSSAAKKRKRKPKNTDESETNGQVRDADPSISTSLETSKASKKVRKKKKNAAEAPKSPTSTVGKRGRKPKEPQSPLRSKKKALVTEPSFIPETAKKVSCLRCREKKIKCNEAKPTCNQCQRGLWTCQYEVGKKKRSKHGCLNCKQRKRKCTEEKPSCAHCLRTDDMCEYASDY